MMLWPTLVAAVIALPVRPDSVSAFVIAAPYEVVVRAVRAMDDDRVLVDAAVQDGQRVFRTAARALVARGVRCHGTRVPAIAFHLLVASRSRGMTSVTVRADSAPPCADVLRAVQDRREALVGLLLLRINREMAAAAWDSLGRGRGMPRPAP